MLGYTNLHLHYNITPMQLITIIRKIPTCKPPHSKQQVMFPKSFFTECGETWQPNIFDTLLSPKIATSIYLNTWPQKENKGSILGILQRVYSSESVDLLTVGSGIHEVHVFRVTTVWPSVNSTGHYFEQSVTKLAIICKHTVKFILLDSFIKLDMSTTKNIWSVCISTASVWTSHLEHTPNI